jgi:presenilin-like A22 family membrane protease
LAISINSVLDFLKYSAIFSIIIALPFAIIKVFNRNILIHNTTEFFIYPGVAAVFVPMLNQMTLIFLLVIISIYDMWAVWKSGIMQKMAKYQIKNVKVFSGFFIPYLSKKELEKLKKSKDKNKNVKANVAILGGGDIIFPIIAAGVMLKTMGIYPALLVIAGATLGLGYLMLMGEKKKFYPAMPFISTGILIGMILSWILF